ncbi:serine protease inhibitor Kazal-type 14 [Cavia porcellus]|uniref:Serine peptidase inhibitor Kazal type 14 (putative) n=1 Tax=Cavia porcellus TaxID=10141 RepID=H0W2K3_CAVPO|nr:serine protease inhibitor Kazal-type 14 [Cavia porcellus]
MVKCLLVLCSLLGFIMVHPVIPSVSGPREWWPPHGTIRIKCPYKTVNLSWLRGTIDPCPWTKQPICGTNSVTYDNPCILCIESLKSRGRIKFRHDGKC